MQCLLNRAAIWARGETFFKSTQSGQWFWLFLHDRHAGLTPENKKLKLAQIDKDPIAIAELERPAKIQRCVVWDEGIVGDGPAEEAEIVEGAPAEEEEVAPAEEEEIAGDEPENAYEPPKEIMGAKVRVEAHRTGERGMRVKCNQPNHRACRRYASLCKDKFGHGPKAAEWTLGAWLRISTPDAWSHAQEHPSKAQIDAFAREFP